MPTLDTMVLECSCHRRPGDGHPSIHLPNAHGGACIDVDLIPVVTWLWDQHLFTTFSCQDNNGRADVTFATGPDLETALIELKQHATAAGCTELADRICGYSPPREPRDQLWTVTVWTRPWFWSDGQLADRPGTPPGALLYQLSWPTSDTAELTRVLNSTPTS